MPIGPQIAEMADDAALSIMFMMGLTEDSMEKLIDYLNDHWYEMVIGALVMNLLSTAMAEYVDNNPLVLMMYIATILAIVWLISVVKHRLTRPLPSIYEGRALGVSRKGIVFTIGLHSHKKGSPALKVLERLKPKYCGLIGTEKTFMDNAGQSIAREAGINAEFMKEATINPTELEDIKANTHHLIQWMMEKGLSARDIVVDITGGTVPMSLAAYLAAVESGIETQYVYSEYDKNKNKALPDTQKALLNPNQVEPVHRNIQ